MSGMGWTYKLQLSERSIGEYKQRLDVQMSAEVRIVVISNPDTTFSIVELVPSVVDHLRSSVDSFFY